MRSKRKASSAAAFCLSFVMVHFFSLSSSGPALSQATNAGNPEVHRLSDNVWAITGLYHTGISKGFTTNAGIFFTKNSIVFIDSGMTIASAQFLWEAAAERMKTPNKLYLILTHHHSDHTFGMRVFKDKGAEIIAHEGIKAELADDNGYYKRFIAERMGWDSKKADEILGNVVLSAPDKTIKQDEILTIDGEEIRLLCVPGHVDDEICVYHPKTGTLFAGDAIYEGSDLATRFGGPKEWQEWISGLERLKKLPIRTIVPGHGKLCAVSEIDRNIDFLKKKLAEGKLILVCRALPAEPDPFLGNMGCHGEDRFAN